MNKQNENYLALQNEWVKLNNVKKGTKVQVVSTFPSLRNGWNNTWITVMNNLLWEDCEVVSIDGINGINLTYNNNLYGFPFFVLEVVNNSIQRKLTKDYDVIWDKGNNYVEVGCQKVLINDIRQLLKDIDDVQTSS